MTAPLAVTTPHFGLGVEDRVRVPPATDVNPRFEIIVVVVNSWMTPCVSETAELEAVAEVPALENAAGVGTPVRRAIHVKYIPGVS